MKHLLLSTGVALFILSASVGMTKAHHAKQVTGVSLYDTLPSRIPVKDTSGPAPKPQKDTMSVRTL
jgi:hypothetical protein